MRAASQDWSFPIGRGASTPNTFGKAVIAPNIMAFFQNELSYIQHSTTTKYHLAEAAKMETVFLNIVQQQGVTIWNFLLVVS